jgi:lipid-binding SYLF domain-containing protein
MAMVDERRIARRGVLALCALAATVTAPAALAGPSRAELNRDGQAALSQLYATAPKAQALRGRALAILVFPKIVKPVGYYNMSAATYGLQAGAQKYAYALFFLTPSSLDYVKASKGWAIGSGPSVVVMDEGKAMSTTSTTVTQDVYAFPFGQKGLMAGLGLEGSKITQINPS